MIITGGVRWQKLSGCCFVVAVGPQLHAAATHTTNALFARQFACQAAACRDL
ncbi:hypothetical protein PF005_g6150 [Phytophthora fragariae]|uniref:Uncharacterized protein n=1 Tax=Phytophthora fragariae TaxID=53985 RepID=A0A6A3LRV1_9STRA|nr:hypothetical protein PF003_g7287 [Phytophthora fragariae]KAE8943316.1 hypothetical protein PF009_g6956 [Phytophthora fragariae]KAE9020888.1 hypothetical protein PF011_g5190 [Phytophthora fragariae]KAE9125059.1 hypothetical protein PF007_g6485 [Phytophthora fragariae]KAE9125601.1 hypothetical protein PF010_g5573 [Phytophthora fragariae]